MTQKTQPVPTAFSPLDMPSLYAVSFGLFAPGALMAARMRATQSQAAPR